MTPHDHRYRRPHRPRQNDSFMLPGAGGLGQLLYFELSLFHHALASTVVIAMLFLSIAVDQASAALRRAMR